jgi:EAL domain-containing protein (putative c-di-GMP-specific phosphodiesterase class I)
VGPEPLRVSVNLSPPELGSSDLPVSIDRILRSTGLDPSLVDLEVTESTLLADEWGSARALRKLKEVGVRLVLDDFGTGFCSLRHLQRFMIDALKIDRSLIAGLGRDDRNGVIVTAVLGMADPLELGVTAEGVETAEELAGLREYGCPSGQGYLFAPPAPPEQLTALLAAQIDLTAIGMARARTPRSARSEPAGRAGPSYPTP